MVKMIAAIEMPERGERKPDAEQECGAERQDRANDKVAGPGDKGRGEIGAHHVERAVREIDEVHNAEHQRQSGRQQEQEQSELQSVQNLFDDKKHADSRSFPVEAYHYRASKGAPWFETRGVAAHLTMRV